MRNNPSKTDLFKARHVEQEIIILCVRFYLRYKLPCRDARRNIATVKAFFLKAIGSQGRSAETITPDGRAALHRTVHKLQQQEGFPN